MSFTRWNDPFDIFFTTNRAHEPQINVGHNEKEIILQVALPGFSRSDIDLEVNSSRLTIKAKEQAPGTGYEYTTREIGMREYTRTWSLPKNVNTEAVEAVYESGILTVHIPYSNSNRDAIRKISLR